ncbi:MAG: Uma2 family endonuclease [Pirellulaceae bacterium]|nr:Uma2 family endonuclease [Pirellulaceae bacterium]
MNSDYSKKANRYSPSLLECSTTTQEQLEGVSVSRDQFCSAMELDDRKVEWIDGQMLVQAPARHWHLSATKYLLTLLTCWVDKHQLGIVQSEKALCIFQSNQYEPDIAFWGPEKSATIDSRTLRFPVPDFIVEVLSETTEGRDRGIKFEDFAIHQVQEYWIVDPELQTIEQYVLEADGKYIQLNQATDEIVRSRIIRGFQMAVQAMFDPNIHRQTLIEFLTTFD